MRRLGGHELRIAGIIGTRGFAASVGGLAVYVVATIGCLVSSQVTKTYLGTIRENGLITVFDPSASAAAAPAVVAALYLAVVSSLSVARDRSSGTLEVLFYGPVNEVSYVLGKYVEQMLTCGVILGFYAIVIPLQSVLAGLGSSGRMWPTLLVALGGASAAVSLGILVSSGARSARSSVTVMAGLLTVLLLIQGANAILDGVDLATLPAALSYALPLISAAGRVGEYVSPFGYMAEGMNALARGDIARYATFLATSLAYSAVLLVLAVANIQRKGVKA